MSDSALARLGLRMLNAFGIGRVTASRDEAGKGARLLQVSLSEEEQRDATPDMAHYGFSSRPRVGADAVLVFAGGDRSAGIVIATGDRRYRLVLAEGEVALHTDEGDRIHMKRGRVIRVETQTLQLVAPTIQMTGDLTHTGNAAIATGGSLTHAGKNIGGTHAHGGVTAGAATTGAPV